MRALEPEVANAVWEAVVVTGSGYGYTRPDGVAVVPVTALGP